MLDIGYISAHADEVKRAVARKRFDVDIDRLLALDAERRADLAAVNRLRQKRNELSELIPKLPAAERPVAIEEGKRLRDRIAQLEQVMGPAQDEIERQGPLLPHAEQHGDRVAAHPDPAARGLSAGRRLGRDPGAVAAVHGWPRPAHREVSRASAGCFRILVRPLRRAPLSHSR
jgi:hypothetical protein